MRIFGRERARELDALRARLDAAVRGQDEALDRLRQILDEARHSATESGRFEAAPSAAASHH